MDQQKAPVKPRRRRLAFLLFTLVALGTFALWFGQREPTCRGKRLSEWLELSVSSGDEQELRSAEAAIRQIGTNGIPCLLKWIQYEPRNGKRPMVSLIEKLPVRLRSSPLVYRLMENRSERTAAEAEMGLEILGPRAAPAIPELARLMNNYTKTNCALSAMRSLGCIGSAALPTLMTAAEDPRCPFRFAAVAMIGMNFRGTNGLPALPALTRCAADHDPRVARASILALGALRLEPQTTIPALTNRLHDARPDIRAAAIYALGAFKEQAPNLLPVLSESFKDPDATVRLESVAVADKFKERVPELVPFLNDATKDPDQNVRAAANDAVRNGRDAAQDFE